MSRTRLVLAYVGHWIFWVSLAVAALVIWDVVKVWLRS